jgi:hypothetical protein
MPIGTSDKHRSASRDNVESRGPAVELGTHLNSKSLFRPSGHRYINTMFKVTPLTPNPSTRAVSSQSRPLCDRSSSSNSSTYAPEIAGLIISSPTISPSSISPRHTLRPSRPSLQRRWTSQKAVPTCLLQPLAVLSQRSVRRNPIREFDVLTGYRHAVGIQCPRSLLSPFLNGSWPAPKLPRRHARRWILKTQGLTP